MSRIAKKPIAIPTGVTVAVSDSTVSVKGKGGELKRTFRPIISIKTEANTVVLEPASDSRLAKVELVIPAGITVTAEKGVITITGIDKEAVGQFAANVRAKKVPEPYKGKGIRYSTEVIRRKQGKKVVG